jgi:hypothetical protein
MPPAFNLSQDQTLQFNLSKKSLKLTLTNYFTTESIRVAPVSSGNKIIGREFSGVRFAPAASKPAYFSVSTT